MTLGLAPRHGDLLCSTVAYCEGRVPADSIYGVLRRECFTLFPDEMFADLFTDVGRRCVPAMIVAVVMVLQRIEGCSDREAVDRFAFDARWKYAAGGLDFDYPGFVHTVLVDVRARLAASERPDRIFEVTLDAAREAGLVGRKRVLDSTPLYDAVATMDTVMLVRSGIRGVSKAAGADLGTELRAVIRRDDDYAAAGKPVFQDTVPDHEPDALQYEGARRNDDLAKSSGRGRLRRRRCRRQLRGRHSPIPRRIRTPEPGHPRDAGLAVPDLTEAPCMHRSA
jgi:Transposase domain (DUF772)